MTNKDLYRIYHKLGLKNNLRDDAVKDIIEAPYKFTKSKINEMDLPNIENEEEFNKLKTNFGYLYLGKIYTTWRSVKNLKYKKHGSD